MYTYHIRMATMADVPAIQRIMRQAYQPYVSRIGREPAPMNERFEIYVNACAIFVIEVEQELAGAIVLVSQPQYLILNNVAVVPLFQRQGFGRMLLTFAEDEARRRKQPEIRLYTNVLMIENIALYSRLGYQETHRAIEDGYDRVYMRKFVPDSR